MVRVRELSEYSGKELVGCDDCKVAVSVSDIGGPVKGLCETCGGWGLVLRD